MYEGATAGVIQYCERLIQQKEIGGGCQGARRRNTAFLTTRQVGHWSVEKGGDVEEASEIV
jgi:hypothetical protein